jgi:hypothetical protein
VQIFDLGGAVVVADEDADAAALAAAEIRQRCETDNNLAGVPIRRAAVFVLEPDSDGVSPGLREFCREQFGAEP